MGLILGWFFLIIFFNKAGGVENAHDHIHFQRLPLDAAEAGLLRPAARVDVAERAPVAEASGLGVLPKGLKCSIVYLARIDT